MNVRRGQGESETQELATWPVAPIPLPTLSPTPTPKLLSAKNPSGLWEFSF